MRKASSLKNLRRRNANIQVVRRGKHVYLIVPGDKNAVKHKAKQ
jgi:ribosomal protein L36